MKKLTQSEFVFKSVQLHSNKYSYEKSIYINNKVKIEITCNLHGSFFQKPNDHLMGHGCPSCKALHVANHQRKLIDVFISQANEIHGNIYNYSQIKYINRNVKVEITCSKHGTFMQSPQIHLRGHGCSRCVGSISKLETQWLDNLNIPEEFRNIFINVNGKKIKVDALYNNTIYEFYGDYWHGNPKIYNPLKINGHNKKSFLFLFEKTIERENLLKQTGYNFVSIWESDYRNN